jgi:hypothetical protein
VRSVFDLMKAVCMNCFFYKNGFCKKHRVPVVSHDTCMSYKMKGVYL